MPLTLALVAMSQLVPPRPGYVSDQLAAAKAVAAYEIKAWRKLHPKADMVVLFHDGPSSEVQSNLVRTRLGFKTPVPILDRFVVTLDFGASERASKSSLSIDASVFFGSSSTGFRAHYVLKSAKSDATVLSRTVIEKYEVGVSKIPPPVPTTPP